MKVIASMFCLSVLCSCALGPGGLTTGVDGCTSLFIEEGQLQVPAVFSANGKNLSWHKINEKCKDVPPHTLSPKAP